MRNKRPPRERRLRIRQERKPVDTKKLAAVLIALAQAQAEADAESDDRGQQKRPRGDAA